MTFRTFMISIFETFEY